MDYQNLSKAELEKEYGQALTYLKQVANAREYSLDDDVDYVAAAERVYKLRREIYRRESEGDATATVIAAAKFRVGQGVKAKADIPGEAVKGTRGKVVAYTGGIGVQFPGHSIVISVEMDGVRYSILDLVEDCGCGKKAARK